MLKFCSSAETTYQYNELGNLTSVTDPEGKKVSYEYDILGLRTSVIYPDGKKVTYSYDALGRLTEVVDWLGGKTAYTYDASGNLISQVLPNKVRTEYSYDPAGRVKSLISSIKEGKKEKLLKSFAYTYDQNGNRISELRDSKEKIDYTYDSLNQLIGVKSKDYQRSYSYDAVGNRVSLIQEKGKGKGVKKTIYKYNQANQLTEMIKEDRSRVTFSYDERGNMVAKVAEGKSTFYTYDSANRLIKVELAGEEETKVVEYDYDALGNRISRKEYEIVAGIASQKKTIQYLNDPSSPLTQVLQVIDEKGKKISFTYGLRRIALFDEKERADYFLYDGLGSVVGLVNHRGSLTAKYTYDEFGIPSPSSKFGLGGIRSNTFGFTGEDYDQEVGLLYLRARYYASEVGRFICLDPTLNVFGKAGSLNGYSYVYNNPAVYTDPLGLWGKYIHYHKTYDWALEVGFSKGEAAKIAYANWQVDILQPGERYERGRHLNTNFLWFLTGETSQEWYAKRHLERAIEMRSLIELGMGLHSVQDLIAHSSIPWVGLHLFQRLSFGWYNPDEHFSWGRLEATEAATKAYLREYLETVLQKV
jgi:RHS repeat-associated protein